MRVTPVAHTIMRDLPESVVDTKFGKRVYADWDTTEHVLEPVTDLDTLGEFAGRACYQAWGLPNPKTAENEGYIANIIGQGHFSVLEHASVTFYVEGVSRSLTHELIRHRHLSYSELSQRYVDVTKAQTVVPPVIESIGEGPGEALAELIQGHQEDTAQTEYAYVLRMLEMNGITGKKAREAARAVMPSSVETKIVVTGNLRAWRDMLGKRWHVAADAEIREFAGKVLEHLRELAPNSVQDIPEVPFGTEEVAA